MELRLHSCNSDDLEMLVQISRSTFITAFRELNNPEDFENYLQTAFHPDRLRAELDNTDSSFYFVYSGDELCGYFKVNQGQAQSDIRDPNSLELERIYVAGAFQGKQIGRWMLDQAVQIARHLEKDYLWLGVWEANTAAIRFYQRHGFVKFGTHPYFIGKDKQTDWLMRLDLDTLSE